MKLNVNIPRELFTGHGKLAVFGSRADAAQMPNEHHIRGFIDSRGDIKFVDESFEKKFLALAARGRVGFSQAKKSMVYFDVENPEFVISGSIQESSEPRQVKELFKVSGYNGGGQRMLREYEESLSEKKEPLSVVFEGMEDEVIKFHTAMTSCEDVTPNSICEAIEQRRIIPNDITLEVDQDLFFHGEFTGDIHPDADLVYVNKAALLKGKDGVVGEVESFIGVLRLNTEGIDIIQRVIDNAVNISVGLSEMVGKPGYYLDFTPDSNVFLMLDAVDEEDEEAFSHFLADMPEKLSKKLVKVKKLQEAERELCRKELGISHLSENIAQINENEFLKLASAMQSVQVKESKKEKQLAAINENSTMAAYIAAAYL